MSETLSYKGEALLYSWSDSAAGRKVTFLLPDEGEEHPFKGYKSGPKYGQAFAIGCAPVDYDNPEPAKPGDPVKSVAGYAKPPMTESQRAGMLCGDAAFQGWLKTTLAGRWDFEADLHPLAPDDNLAACVVRNFLQVKSRKELDSDNRPDTLKIWHQLRGQFEADTGRIAERR